MATIAGTIQNLSNGIFHVKDENGNIRVLKEGDTIYENDTVYGDSTNTASSKVEILLSGNDVIVLNEGAEQLIDSSLIETAFGTEELFFTREGLDLQADSNKSDADVVSDLRDANFDEDKKADIEDKTLIATNSGGDVTDQDTAAGVQVVEDATDVPGIFQARDGNITNIVSDLRDAQFPTQNQININGSNLVIGNLSVNDITAYEDEGFLVFTVTLDRSLASDISFDYATSAITASNNGVDYSDVSGRITIPAGSTSVTIRVPITDDYVSDNGETIRIIISNVDGNANITKAEGIGTILDNPVNNPGNGTTGTPTETDGYGEEDTVYAVITGATSVIEGETAGYVINLIDKDGNPVTVTNATDVKVIFTNVSTEDADTEYSNNQIITVTIPAGGSSITLDADTVDDYLADSPEDYKLTINEVVTTEFENVVIGDKDGNNKDVTTTITEDSTDNPNIPGDEDTVYAVITGSTNVIEGETASYIINLVDKDGNPVTVTEATDVTVKFTNITTQDGDTEYSNNQIITVTIPAGGSSITLDADTIDDYYEDSLEDYKLTIDGVDTTEFENVDIDGFTDTTGTIHSGSQITTITDDTGTPNNPTDGPEENKEIAKVVLVAVTAGQTLADIPTDANGALIIDNTNTTPEGGKLYYIAVAVDADGKALTTQDGTVTVTYNDGSATHGAGNETDDYTVITTTATIGTTFSVDAEDDYYNDNNETFEVVISAPTGTSYENVEIDAANSTVTSTITDDTGTPNNPTDGPEGDKEIAKVVLVAVTAGQTLADIPTDANGALIIDNTNTTPEGGKLYYIAVAVDADGKALTTQDGTVTVTYNDGSATHGAGNETDDYTVITTTATIGTTFSVDAEDDYYNDNNETFEVVISAPTGTSYENVEIDAANSTVTSTITDDTGTPNNPTDGPEENKEIAKVVLVAVTAGQTLADIPTDANGALIIDNTNTTPEGGKLYYIAVAVDADGKALTTQDGTVTVTYNDGSATHGAGNETDDYTVITTTATIGTTFSVDAEDDYYNDNNETFEVVISAPTGTSYENVEIDAANSTVTSTITDDTGTPNNPTDGPEENKEIAKVVLVAVTAGQTLADIPTDANGALIIDNTNTTPEGGKLYYIAVAVDADGKALTTQDGTVTVTYNDGSATHGAGNETDDYTVITTTATIGTTFSVDAEDDYYNDNNETFEVVISAPTGTSYENVEIDAANSTVTSTITDDTGTPNNPTDGPEENKEIAKVVLVAVTAGQTLADIPTDANGALIIDNTNTTPEGGKLYYIAVAVDADGKALTTQDGTVTVTYNDGSATHGAGNETDDYTVITTTATIGTTFSVDAEDDYYNDNNETFEVVISAPTGTSYENVEIDAANSTVTSTITDDTGTPNNPTDGPEENKEIAKVVLVAVTAGQTLADIPTDANGALIIDNTNTTPEGGKLYYIAVAVDADGKALTTQDGTVTVTYNDGSATHGAGNETDDYTVITTTATIGTTFSVDAEDDYYNDNNETFEVVISAPTGTSYENVEIDAANSTVTSTITDDTGTPNNPTDGPEENKEIAKVVLVAVTAGQTLADIPTDANGALIIDNTNTTPEGGKLYYIAVAVDADGKALTTQDGTVTVTYNDGSATHGAGNETDDYTVITTTATIGTTFSVDAEDDYYNDNNETFEVVISAPTGTSYENVEIDAANSTVTSTITDDTGTPNNPTDGPEENKEIAKVVLVAVTAGQTLADIPTDANGALIIDNTNTTPEGGKLYYIAVAVDADGKALTTQDGTVTVTYNDGSATHGAGNETDDYTVITTTATIGTTFSVDAEDDYYNDNNETFEVVISAPTGTSYENVEIDAANSTVTSTITDDTGTPNNPTDGPEENKEIAKVVLVAVTAGQTLADIPTDANGALIIDNTNTTPEGGKLYYIAVAVDADGKALTTQDGTVTVTYNDGSATHGAGNETDDYTVITTTATIGTTFSVDAEDDYYNDNNETFEVVISAPTGTSYENVEIDAANSTVTSTITDDTGTPNNPTDGPEENKEIAKVVLVAVTAGQTLADIPTDANGALIIDNTNTTPEGGKLYYIAVAVDADGKALTTQDGTVTVTYNDGSATHGAGNETDDYTVITTTATIGTTFSVDAEDDYYNDNNETFEVVISAPTGTSYENVEIDAANSTVTSTITDDTGTPNNPTDGPEGDKEIAKVVLVAVTAGQTLADIPTDANGALIIDNTNTTPEGGKLYYIAVAVDADGKALTTQDGTVTVTYNDGSATHGAGNETDDYTVITTTATIGTTFSVDAEDDYYNDNNETFEVVISAPTGTSYENVEIDAANSTVTSTITDDTGTPNNPTDGPEGDKEIAKVVLVAVTAGQTLADIPTDANGALIIDNTNTTPEGGKLYYIAVAVDADGKALTTQDGTVTVTYNDGSATHGAGNETDDYTVITTTATIGTTFSVDAEDDYYNDNNETFEVVISAPTGTSYENVEIDAANSTVTSTITDDTGTPNNPTDGPEGDKEIAKVVLVAVTAGQTLADIPTDANGALIIDNTNTTPEGGKLYYIAVAVDADGKALTTQDGTVTVTYNDGSATHGAGNETDDYTVITTTATIGTTFSVDAEDDYYNDNNETFEVVISAPTGTSYENVEIDAANSTVTSTITDDTGTPNNPTDGPEENKEIAKVVLVATNAAGDILTDANGVVLIDSTNEAVEGGKLYYIAVAVDADGKQLISSGNIDVSFIDGVDGSNGATSGAGNLTDDYSHTTINIAIGEVFEAKTLDDFVEDSPENYTVVISNPTGTNYENVIVDSANSTVTSTIQDGVIVGAAAVAKVYEDALVDDIKDTDTSNPLISGEGVSSALISEATLNITNPNNDTYSVEFKNGDFPTLTSEGQTVTIAINSSGVLIGTRTDGKEVFSVAFDKTDATKYTVTLSQPIDHTTGNDGYDLLNIPIEYIVSSDGSSIEKTMNITVVDSAPQLINETIVLNEDSSASSAGNTFILADEFVSGSGSSSLTLAGADITATNATVTIDENGDDVTISGKTAVGTVTSNGDGSVSFVPASNFSGTVTVDYTIIDFDGDIATTELTFEVTPIADAPTMQDNISLSTYEDNSWNGTSHNGDKVNIVALGLIVPTITDATDLTSGADDASERLSALTFKFGSNKDFDGAVIKYDSNGDGTLDATLQTVNRGDSFTIMISDITDYHPNGTTATYSLTQAQYNSLVIIPEADNANDISFTISTESHEVQDNGDLYATDIVSATKTQTVDIDVKAVTDPVTLREDTSATNYDGVDDQVMNITIAEDATLDLAALLVQTFGDNDSSESHYFDVSGLEPGTKITIGGTTRTADSNGDITQVKFTGDDTTFKITPPADWDGTMTGITLTLMAKDSDSDSTGVNQWETDSVTLNLTVTPVANDVVVVNPVSGEEDTAISLFVDANGDLTIQTTDTAGTSEDSITGVKILTSSIVGTISGGTTTIDGLYTVFDVNTLADYKITPPAHSSSDITMKLIVKTTDGTSVLEHSEVDYKVTVTPVAEEVGIDSDGDGIDDVTMTADHTYALDAKEDSWFTLGTDTGFNLESNWSNEDDTDLTAGSHTTAQTNSEETFAHLTFTVSENGTYVEISGADYKYYNGSSYITVTDTGSGVDIPVAYLDTLEVLAPSQLSGDIRIEVQTKTVDYDEDTNAQVTSLSGLSYLTFTVDPVADIGTIQVAQSVEYEDAGRTTGNTSASGSLIDAPENGIALNIKVSSDDKDGSETFNVQIDKIPDGGSLNVYDNSTKTWKLITISSDGTGVTIDGISTSTSGNISVDTTADGTYKVTIIDYQNNQLAKFIPAHNDDTDYTFKVSSQTVDTSTTTVTGDYGTSKDLSVIVKNIADVAISNELKTDITANEDSQINLKDIYLTPSTLASSDSSEELTIKIDLPDGFTIVSGSPYYIEDGLYVVNASDIIAGNIVIDIPDNFSGDTSFDLTYITTEKAGEGSSKTGITQTVNVFVNPIADDVTVAKSSTINEDADGSANKLSLTPTLTDTDGSESVTAVKILASSVPSAYTLYSDASMTTELTLDANGYYIVTDANSVYAKNTTEHKLDGNFDLTVVYTVTDTVGSQTDTKDFTHVHTVNVNAVTDTPTIALGTISETSGSVTVVGTNVTVNTENSEFTVPVTTTSEDADSSETVTKIVISGVPQGVEVVGATYYGYAGSEDNGIWVLTSNSDTTLDSNGALSDVVFKVNTGADFEERDITITTYIQDGANAQVENDSTTIHIDKFLGTGTGAGTPADLELAVKDYDIKEDTEFSLGSVLAVSDKVGSSKLGSAIITISDLPEGSIVTGADYSYIDNGKTYYVVVGNGNAADMSTQLSDVLITTPKDMNTGGDTDGQFTFTATITSYDQDVYNSGNEVSSIQDIAPITDKMTITVDASNILEDDTSALTITLSNPNDGSKTELLEDSITVKISETWKDSNTNGEGTKGTLTDSSGTYNIVDNNDGTYTVTKINGSAFTLDTSITGLVYTPAENRDGDVIFEVSVKNKETGSTLELDSKGDKTITVSPMIDAVLDAAVSTTTGTEDVSLTIGTTKLENAVKLEIATGTIIDGSEKLGNVILDEVPTGFTVWYINNSGTLVMATNVGTTDDSTNQWLITAKSDGSMPEVYINAPENWAGDFDFKAKFTLSEENLSTTETTIVNVTGHIDAVADGLTIDLTLTFGEAYSWVNLNLNANMVDVDGSETMSIKLTGLDDMAQFQLDNGTSLTSNATYNDLDSTWTIEGIQYDQINNVQFVNDTSSTVSVEAWTVDGSSESSHTNSETFDLSLTDVSGILTLNEGINLDFDKAENLSNIEEIDLSSTGANNILNLSLQDVIAMTDSNNDLKITGDSADSVTFKDGTGTDAWSTNSTVTEGGKTFDVYTNTDDNTVQVKVEQPISDGITN